MPAVTPVATSADKWVRRAGQAGPDYTRGVNNPRTPWAEATAAAVDAQSAGIQQAIANGSFVKGVQKAGNAKWQRKAAGLGAARFGAGVADAQPDYVSGFTPYAAVIQGITLPPRGPKGDPRNYERTKIIGDALHAAKVGA